MQIKNNKGYIKTRLSNRAVLEQLAEEAAEVSQAALKLIRTMPNSENPTPVTFNQACEDLTQELFDVVIAADILGLTLSTEAIKDDHPKIVRWAERLRQRGLRSNANQCEV
jgi:NTP pyrophosphatase (non-canonical NTP hydrolase)